MQAAQPDLIPTELTKFAMRKYREIYSNGTNGGAASKADGATVKRKIDVDNGSEPLTGVAKLAKFNFSK